MNSTVKNSDINTLNVAIISPERFNSIQNSLERSANDTRNSKTNAKGADKLYALTNQPNSKKQRDGHSVGDDSINGSIISISNSAYGYHSQY